jgi:hypothetical protein
MFTQILACVGGIGAIAVVGVITYLFGCAHMINQFKEAMLENGLDQVKIDGIINSISAKWSSKKLIEHGD